MKWLVVQLVCRASLPICSPNILLFCSQSLISFRKISTVLSLFPNEAIETYHICEFHSIVKHTSLIYCVLGFVCHQWFTRFSSLPGEYKQATNVHQSMEKQQQQKKSRILK
jgi:hypothetical protein